MHLSTKVPPLLTGRPEWSRLITFSGPRGDVGWLVVSRIYVALAAFQPYRNLEVGDNQSLFHEIQVARPEIEPGPLAPQAKSLTQLATAGPSRGDVENISANQRIGQQSWFTIGTKNTHLFRPDSSNLPCHYSTFHLENPLVHSRFCLERTVAEKMSNQRTGVHLGLTIGLRNWIEDIEICLPDNSRNILFSSFRKEVGNDSAY